MVKTKPPEEIVKTKINGLEIVKLIPRVDDRGYLIEILRDCDPHFTKFGQVYLVGNMARGAIRAFHKHDVLWDWFFITHGSAKFAFHDGRPDSPTHGVTETIVTSERNPSMIIVPPGVFHGWMSLEDDTQMISIASEVYNREKPDEVRVPPNSFGYSWEITGR